MPRYFWEIAEKQSVIFFKVKYLRFSNITGSFLKFIGSVVADDLFQDTEVTLHIEAGSVETHHAGHNMMLKGGQCLSVTDHPRITFHSVGGCKQSAGKIWELSGELTLKEYTTPLTLVVSL